MIKYKNGKKCNPSDAANMVIFGALSKFEDIKKTIPEYLDISFDTENHEIEVCLEKKLNELYSQLCR